jgi:hypothetical protein
VLGDCPGFPVSDGCTPDPVEELGFTVIDMTEDTDYGLPYCHGTSHLFIGKGKGKRF